MSGILPRRSTRPGRWPKSANVEEDCGCEKKPDPLTALWDDFDLENLPSAEVMARYFGTSDGYSVIDENGLRSELTIYYPEL